MKALIITDGTESIQSIALLIKESLAGVKSKGKITTGICTAQNLKGNEILPADIFFLGCEEPSPSSFTLLEEILSHINLAPRKCGVFSVKAKTNKYLLSILKDSEADTKEPFLAENGNLKKSDIKKWLKQITG